MPKTIFGTTEKSNFILNMKNSTVQKWLHAVLLMCVILPQLGSLIITFTNTTSVWLATFLYVAGFTGILFYLIVMLRGEIKFLDNKSYIFVSLIALFTLVSYYGIIISGGSDEMMKTAIFGEQGRYEGLISIVAYLGIFLVATCISNKKDIINIFDILIATGIVQAIVAIFQHIPGLGFPSDFRDLPFPYLLKNCYLSSGLADSPIFFGTYLTIVFGIALTGAIYDKSTKRAIIYGIASVLFVLTGFFTSSIVPIIGMLAAMFISIIIYAFVRFKKSDTRFDKNYLKVTDKKLLVLAALFGVVTVLIAIFQGVYIRDFDIAYSDAYYRLFIVLDPSKKITQKLYEIAWTRSIEFIKMFPITGLGSDCMAMFQVVNNKEYGLNSIDRSYNEYLYIAVTRGIPSLIAYLGLLIYAFIKLFKSIKEFFKNSENWFRPALLTTLIAFSIQAFWGASSITVSPFFWLILGIACASRINAQADSKALILI